MIFYAILFVEEEFSKDNLWWGPINQKINTDVYEKLYGKILDYYAKDADTTYIFEGYAGADENYKLPIRVIAKKAWQYMFCRNMFINRNGKTKNFNPEFTIINASDVINEDYIKDKMNSDVFVIFNLLSKSTISFFLFLISYFVL